MLAFVRDAIDAFDVSPKGSHIASVSYSTTAVVDFRFNTLLGDKLNGVELKKLVDRIRHQRGFTYIDRALKLADEDIFSDKGGMRQAVKKVSSSRCFFFCFVFFFTRRLVINVLTCRK